MHTLLFKSAARYRGRSSRSEAGVPGRTAEKAPHLSKRLTRFSNGRSVEVILARDQPTVVLCMQEPQSPLSPLSARERTHDVHNSYDEAEDRHLGKRGAICGT